jgi:hypothetical protein
MARLASSCVLVAGCSLLLAAACCAGGEGDVDITGVYRQDGGPLTCTIRKNGDVYKVTWERRSDGTVWIGLGFLRGRTFSTAWDFPNGGDLGLAIYQVGKGEGGPRLVGQFADYAGGKLDRQAKQDRLIFVRR